MATDSANYYMLVNEWVWSKLRDCLLRPEVDMGAVLESAWTEMEILIGFWNPTIPNLPLHIY